MIFEEQLCNKGTLNTISLILLYVMYKEESEAMKERSEREREIETERGKSE